MISALLRSEWFPVAVVTGAMWFGYGIRWWQDRHDWQEGYEEGCDDTERGIVPVEWPVHSDADTIVWMRGLRAPAAPSPVMARASRILTSAEGETQ